ncbi:MAG: hypothetical protein HYX21_00995 [Candidatus Yanofskybacteria bacterium]|nr:hypothetical protein [Candidatus Yanofskybacteria bacterium]
MHIKKGLAMHVHHEKLVEWCFNYDERAEFIRTEKPPEERETRLRLFKLFKGELPPELVEAGRVFEEAQRVYVEAGRVYDEAGRVRVEAGRVYDEAFRVYDEARRVYNKAGQVYDESVWVHIKANRVYVEAERVYDGPRQVRVEAGLVYDIAGRVYDEAGRVFNEAHRAYDKVLNKNMPAIEALHRIECPNCPWNGHTIFPKT